MKEAVLQHLGIAIVPAWCRDEMLAARRDEAGAAGFRGGLDAAVCGLSGDALDVGAGAQLPGFPRGFLDFIVARAERFNA